MRTQDTVPGDPRHLEGREVHRAEPLDPADIEPRLPDGDAFLRALLRTPEGRAYLLSVAVDAEESDEHGLFDAVADAIEVPGLRRAVVAHRADERRHAALFRGCLERNGYPKWELPTELSLVHQLRGTDDPPTIETPDEIATFCALLLAVEERGVQHYPRIGDAFERHDPETAEVYRRVTRDERGHVRSCNRIGRHYAGSDDAWDTAVAAARDLEAAAFVRAGLAQVMFCAQHGLVDLDDILVPIR